MADTVEVGAALVLLGWESGDETAGVADTAERGGWCRAVP